MLLRPASVPPRRRGWLPLLAGVATATAVRHVSGLDARLKWPNDLLIGPRKLAGILAEQSGDAVIVGIGVNVSAARAELPVTGAAALPGTSLPGTSLLLEGSASLDRERLLREILAEIERWYRAWRGAEIPGDPQASGLRAAYLGLCSTVGRDVQAELSAGNIIRGTAAGIDADGTADRPYPSRGRWPSARATSGTSGEDLARAPGSASNGSGHPVRPDRGGAAPSRG